MKYAFTTLPSTAHDHKFKVQDTESKGEAFFNISRDVVSIWGNPAVAKMEQYMIGYLKKNGWPKEPVNVTMQNTPKDLSQGIADFAAKSGKK
jgi:hypothetical protein